MKIRNAHILRVNWKAFVGLLIACAFLFSASSFANTGTMYVPMQMSADNTASAHKIAITTVDEQGMEHMGMQNECCDDKEAPCEDDGNCNVPCMSFSVSHAVLAAGSSLTPIRSLTVNTAAYILEDGILPVLNAPPPRA